MPKPKAQDIRKLLDDPKFIKKVAEAAAEAQREKNEPPTLVNILLDASGSMASIRDTVISSFNEYVQSLKSKEQNFLVSVTPFNHKVMPRTLAAVSLDQIRPMDRENYRPEGNTALYDAIGENAAYIKSERARLKKIWKDAKIPVFFVIITDGEENSSVEYTRDKVKKIIRELEEEYETVCVYLGANQDAWAVGASFGIRAGNTFSYTASATGTSNAFMCISGATGAFATASANGASAKTYRASSQDKPTIEAD